MEWLQTYKIGEALLKSGDTIEEAYYQNYKPIKNKDNQEAKPSIVNIKVDTEKEIIEVERLAFDPDISIKADNYFTSISGNFTSYYLCNTYNSCKSILDFLGIEDGEAVPDEIIEGKTKKVFGLKKVFTEIAKSRNKDFSNALFMSYREKIRANNLLCEKLDALINGLGFIVEQSKKLEKWNSLKLFSKVEQQSFSQFSKLNYFPKDRKKGNDEVVFVTLTIDLIRLNRDIDYKSFCIERFLDIGRVNYKKIYNSESYFGNTKNAFNVSFPRDSINILKASTGSPTTLPNLTGTNFLLSEEAYNALKIGAKKIDTDLKIRIARITHYVIPEFTEMFQIKRLRSEIVEQMELALNLTEFGRTQKSLFKISNNQVNSVTLLAHQKGKGDIDLISTIRIPSLNYFTELTALFHEGQSFFGNFKKFSFQQIYYLFPVPSDKSKKPDSLFFYKSIFEKTPYSQSSLMDTYADLIRIYRYGRSYEKAGRKLYGGTVNLSYSEKIGFNLKISDATRKFQALLNLLNLLFNKDNKNEMDYSKLPPKTQELFKQCNYSEDKASLFYLGKLLRLVADAQAKKQKNKRRPVLDKINYSGMSISDLKWLFSEVFEKMKQYEVLKYAHEDITEFKRYFDLAEAKGWKLTEIENVFYLFSGYAMYWEVMEDKTKNSIEKLKLEEQEETTDAAVGDDDDNEEQNEED